ncbi:MAG: hypothetical protein IPJ84_01345 [Bdellovibrionales bacterium]|nr:hypothetical protein [Bdellovibrionales bacterium]
MRDLFDGIMVWKEFSSIALAHLEVSSLCAELSAESVEHRVVEIMPLANGALALVLLDRGNPASLPSWQSSLRSRSLVDALYSLHAVTIADSDKISVADMARADELLVFCDHALASSCEILDLQLRRSGAAGGHVFLRGTEEVLTQLEASNQKRLGTFGRIRLSGEYRRFWL